MLVWQQLDNSEQNRGVRAAAKEGRRAAARGGRVVAEVEEVLKVPKVVLVHPPHKHKHKHKHKLVFKMPKKVGELKAFL